ncbi:MAG: excinuclease ABC subunit UvrC [Sandaracinus sp.]|nr:excinuclease ABC subunit UvrC [Sandaracinus sp.]MCB9614954.1 excinuclease ABC subunit UvrC [Sandaracinus sp.]MCB9618555.1 excinuclease ABC subunit UvrC [Sandaracinus sp.]MCB9622117.1 excinuclease ABC subunit UvrC [Sandaracinus sp.]
MALAERVQEKLETLPTQPGVYVFRGANDVVIYVGKARSLRSRVRSYFQPGSSDVRAFVARLENELTDIETFVADTEKEAALLENQLIKEHQPRYNVKLRDDKEYLSLRLDPKGKWPRLEVVRRPRPDGAHYFGPYHSATAARQTLRLVNRHFQLRTCTDSELRNRSRPCLQYQIKRCPGPCVYEVDREEYGLQVRSVARFLDGRHDELVDELTERMKVAATSMEYERAALYRDQIRAVDRAREDQRVATVKDLDQDVLGYFRQADQAEVAVLLVRGGRLVGVRTFDLRGVSLPDDELVAHFVGEWYARASVPDEIVLPLPIEAMDGLAEVLGESRRAQGKKAPRIVVPNRQARRKLVDMAMDNAAHAFREKRVAENDVAERLAQIQKRLHLPKPPQRIECIDVSHLGGEDAVAAIVAFTDGVPDKKGYRSFRVKRAKGGDDYGSMYEVLSRRFRRGRDGEAGWELPDLFVVDGGKGQLGVALAVLSDLQVPTFPVVGLAKERESPIANKEKVVDRVYLPGAKNAIPVHNTPALQLLAHARDEAHRFSNAIRLRRGAARRFHSELEDVKGVGARTRQRLLQRLGSLEAIRLATEEALIAAGASAKQAKAIRETLGREAAPTFEPRESMENLGEELEVEASPDEGLDAAELDELASTASEE